MKLSHLVRGGLLIGGTAVGFWAGLVLPTSKAKADETHECKTEDIGENEDGDSCSRTCCIFYDDDGDIVDDVCGDVCVHEG
jgi:hypothetical protein